MYMTSHFNSLYSIYSYLLFLRCLVSSVQWLCRQFQRVVELLDCRTVIIIDHLECYAACKRKKCTLLVSRIRLRSNKSYSLHFVLQTEEAVVVDG